MKTTPQIVAVGTAPIAAEWAGSGQPIVFLHANVADRRMWRHQFDAFAASNRVIAFDRRGFGETAMVDETYSQTDDLFAVLDRLAGRDKPAILVGCSRGGSIAIDAALASPDRVAALILVAPGVSGAPAATPIGAVQRLLDATEFARKSGDLDEVNRLQGERAIPGAGASVSSPVAPLRARRKSNANYQSKIGDDASPRIGTLSNSESRCGGEALLAPLRGASRW